MHGLVVCRAFVERRAQRLILFTKRVDYTHQRTNAVGDVVEFAIEADEHA